MAKSQNSKSRNDIILKKDYYYNGQMNKRNQNETEDRFDIFMYSKLCTGKFVFCKLWQDKTERMKMNLCNGSSWRFKKI